MKYVILTLLGAMLVCATALAQGGSITVSHVDGAWDSGGDWYIYPDCGHGSGVTFHIHYTNNSGGYVTGMANGFALTGTGPVAPPTVALEPATTICNYFNLVCQASVVSSSPWIIGASFSIMADPGLPDGYSEDVFTITTHGVSAGETLCLDSSFFPPSGAWLWSPGVFPSWDGPHCYQAMAMPCGWPEFTNIPTEPLTLDHCQPASFVFEAEHPMCEFPFWIYQIGGPGTTDSVSGVWNYTPSLGDVGSVLGVQVEACDISCNCSGVETLEVVFTNEAPVFTQGPGEYIATDVEPISIGFEGDTADCDPVFSMSFLYVSPTPDGPYSFEDDTLTFAPVPWDLHTTYTFVIAIADGLDTTLGLASVAVISPPCCDIRGDIDYSWSGPDIADLVYLVNYMFNSGWPSSCPANADIDGNGIGPDIVDLVYLVNYMFNSGPPPVACP